MCRLLRLPASDKVSSGGKSPTTTPKEKKAGFETDVRQARVEVYVRTISLSDGPDRICLTMQSTVYLRLFEVGLFERLRR